MTTSDFLNVQADLLSALQNLRRARLEEFVARARGSVYTGEPVRDRDGWPVAADAEAMAEIAEAAIEFRNRALRRGKAA